MTLRLIKMAAGIKSLEALGERQAFVRQLERAELGSYRPGAGAFVHITRFMPKRRLAILSASDQTGFNEAVNRTAASIPGDVPGSLYWVFQKHIQARQEIIDLVSLKGTDGQERCGIVLAGPLIRVERYPQRAFQGWRYLDGADAPADLPEWAGSLPEIPSDMRQELEDLCLI